MLVLNRQHQLPGIFFFSLSFFLGFISFFLLFPSFPASWQALLAFSLIVVLRKLLLLLLLLAF